MNYKNLPAEAFEKALLQIDRIMAEEIFENCYLEYDSFKPLEHLTIEALKTIGERWEEGKLSLSQVYMSGVICEELIEKYMHKFDITTRKDLKIGIGVLLDHHALGKRIVYSILRSSGYDVIDFGEGLSVNAIVEKTLEKQIDCLLISTLMLPSALQVKNVVKELRKKQSATKIIAGGAPFRLDNNLWKKVNADADGKNGSDIPGIIEKMIERGNKDELNATCNSSSKP